MKNFLLMLLLVSGHLWAQTEPVQNFSLLNVADNQQVALESFSSCSAVVVVFTSNECVYDNQYTARMRNLIDAYKGKVQFLLVNSYVEPAESVEKMRVKYNVASLPAPYLADKDQVAMECLGAKKSPEVFLLSNRKGKYFLTYSGAIDDNAQVATDVHQPYLKNAIDQLLANQKIEITNVRAVGCTIRRK